MAPSSQSASVPVALASATQELNRLFATLDPAPLQRPTDSAPPPASPHTNPLQTAPTSAILPAPTAAQSVTPAPLPVSASPLTAAPTAAAPSTVLRLLRAVAIHSGFIALTLGAGLSSIGAGIVLAEYRNTSPILTTLSPRLTIPPAQQRPPLEQGLQYVQSLPIQWSQKFQQSLGSPQLPQSQGILQAPGSQANPQANSQSHSLAPSTSIDQTLSPSDRQGAEEELARLQQEVHQLREQVVTLEQKLGLPGQGASLDVRLEHLQQALAPLPTAPDPSVRVTLPSDVLFGDSEAQLRPDASRLLSSIISDLRRHSGAQVTIAAHTDDIGDPDTNLTLSLRQSRALAQYLENHLGSQYQWTPLGYGASQPLADNSTNSNRQRNRRIEIQITP